MAYTKMTVETLCTGLRFPEGPAFDQNGVLWCVELQGGALVSWDSGTLQRYPSGGAPNGLAVDHQGSPWFCDSERNAIRAFEPRDGTWLPIAGSVDATGDVVAWYARVRVGAGPRCTGQVRKDAHL